MNFCLAQIQLSVTCSTLNCNASDGKLGEDLGTRLNLCVALLGSQGV